MVEALDRRNGQGKKVGLVRLLGTAAALCAGLAVNGPAVAAINVASTVDGVSSGAELAVVDGKIELGLDQALALALEHNLGLRVQRYSRTQSWYSILQTKGVYDLNLSGQLSTSDSSTPTGSRLEASSSKDQTWNLGLNQLLAATNGVGRVDFNNSRSENASSFTTLNPRFDSSLRLGFTQPLLRDFGRSPATRALRVARASDAATGIDFERLVSGTIESVDRAYWRLVEAYEQLYVARQSLSLAEELHGRNKIQVDVGTLAPLELVQSEAAIATREEGIIRAEAEVGNAADQLRQLLALPAGTAWSAEIVPTTKPEIERISIDVDQAFETALASRAEIRVQEKQIERLAIEDAFSRNQLKPSLDLNVGYRLSGLGGTTTRDPDTGAPLAKPIKGGYSDALSQVRRFDFDGWSATLTLGVPIQNRTAKAAKIIAGLDLERGQVTLAEVKLQVTTEVRTAARAVVTAAKQIDAARISVKFQERNLDAEKKRYENGMATSFRINQVQDDLTQARSREVSAVVNYRTSLATYYGAIGKLLEQQNVEIAQPAGDPKAPCNCDAKDAKKGAEAATPAVPATAEPAETAEPAKSGGAGR